MMSKRDLQATADRKFPKHFISFKKKLKYHSYKLFVTLYNSFTHKLVITLGNDWYVMFLAEF